MIATEPAGAARGQGAPPSLRACIVRPARSTDEPALLDMFSRSSPEDIRLRCLGVIKDFPHLAAARLAHYDSDREIALVAIDAETAKDEIVGVVHLIAEPPEPDTAEFDIMVRTDMKGHGIGFHLMTDVLARARERGLKTIVGYISSENRAMLLMTHELGFRHELADMGVVRVRAEL